MKLVTLFATVSLIPSCINAAAYTDWSFKDNPPADGFDKLEFSWSADSALDEPGWYMASQFGIVDRHSVGYCGIQPQNETSVRALFSIFGDKSEVVDNINCSEGADDGDGVSCAVTVHNFEVGKRYYITVERKDNHTYEGILSDENGLEQRVGAWRLLDEGGTKGFANGQTCFLEWFKYGAIQCEVVTEFIGTYYAPSAPSLNWEGMLHEPTPQRTSCLDKINFGFSGDERAYTLRAGWPGLSHQEWNIPDAPPENGLDEIEFSFELLKEQYALGYTIVQRFEFIGHPGVGSVNVDPVNLNRGRVEVFVPGKSVEPIDPKCHSIAEGVICESYFGGFEVGTRFFVRLKRRDNSTWDAILEDKKGLLVQLGSVRLIDEDVEGLKGSQLSYFDWKLPILERCDNIRDIEVKFHPPSAPKHGTRGTLGRPYAPARRCLNHISWYPEGESYSISFLPWTPALCNVGWDFPSGSEEGLDKIVFPFQISVGSNAHSYTLQHDIEFVGRVGVTTITFNPSYINVEMRAKNVLNVEKETMLS